MNDNLTSVPARDEASTLSNYTLVKFAAKLIRNQPSKIITLAKMWLMNSGELGVYLGTELVEVLKALKPNFRDLVNALISSNQATDVDELYETIKPLLDNLLNKSIGNYGVSLSELGAHKLLTETYIKNSLLPIVLTIRDIPKFCKSIKEKDFLKIIQDAKAKLTTHLETDLHAELRKYLLVGTDGIYVIKPDDPALVSQIKKILNAFTYSEKVITFINSLDLNPDTGFKLEVLLEKKGEKQVEFLTKVIWYLAMKDSVVGNYLSFSLDLEPEELNFIHEIEQAINYVRIAQSSLLEIDIPTYQIFESELKIIDGFISSLQEMSTGEVNVLWKNKLSNAQGVAEVVSEYVGKPAGRLIEYLRPNPGKKDFSFLINHLGLLPGYLDELTRWIYSYGAGRPTRELALSEADNEVFKDSAIKLFFGLSNFNNLFFWQKTLNILFPIRKDAVTLGQGIYQQVLRVNEATGEMVAYQLSRVKKELFTQIICESDKLELYLGLAPGVLTKLLMLRLDELYQILVGYASSIVDLKESYPDLLQLDNTSFLMKRLQNILQQKNECQLKLDRAQKAKKELHAFAEEFNSGKTTEERIRLKALYQSFKPYVIEYNPRLSVLLDEYFSLDDKVTSLSFSDSDLKLMYEAVECLCNKEMATFDCYLTLAHSYLKELPKQVKGKLYPLSPHKKHSLLMVNEYNWLVENDGLVPEESITLNKEQPFIEDLSTLTPENRAELYNYHSIRALTLNHIYQEIGLFLHQLSEADWFTNQKSITSIIERYRVIQPYFVDSGCSETDDAFVGLLNQLSTTVEKPPKFIILDAINGNMNELKQQIAKEIKSSECRQTLFEFAHLRIREKKSVFFNDAPLSLDSELVRRQDKWIRHQHLSRVSTNMKDTLLTLLRQFDPSLKLATTLSRVSDVVPFPEMERDLEALTVPTQVSWAKRMLNVIHYIDSNFKYLESLDRDVHKKDVTHYFLKGPLVEGIYQLKPFLELTKAYQTLMELMQEPTGQVLFDTFGSMYERLIEAWELVKPLYFISSDEIRVEKPRRVNSSGLWYPILSLMVFPEHLAQLSAGKSYTPVQAEKAQKTAKEVAQYIEQVTEEFQASQYFILLLKSPYILFKLVPQLKKQWDKLCSDTNQITLAHLKDIQATLYSILEETDALELQFGLRIGLISHPTKLILDKLFTRFIEPLSIDLHEAAALVQDSSSFEKRLQINHQKQNETKEMLDSEKRVFLSLDYFLKILEAIKAKIDKKQDISPTEKEQFKKLYWDIYPLLQSQQSHYQLSLDQRDKSAQLDAFCNDCFSEQLKEVAMPKQVCHYASLKDVMYLVLHVHAAKKGNINSLEMRASYLNRQAQSISTAKQHFNKVEAKEALETCIRNAIDSQIELICKKTNQLVYLESEYKSILLKDLLSKKDEILKKLNNMPVEELAKSITAELKKQFHSFSQKQYLQLVHLDSILAEIERFQFYCQKEKHHPIYEHIDPVTGTLMPKIELLNKLKTLAQNDQVSLDERIAQLKKEAQKDTFYTILMSHDNYFKLEFKALKRLFLNLFHSILNFFGMAYRPADFYTSLDKVMKAESSSFNQSVVKKSGFFSASQDKLTDISPNTRTVLSEQDEKHSAFFRG